MRIIGVMVVTVMLAVLLGYFLKEFTNMGEYWQGYITGFFVSFLSTYLTRLVYKSES